MHTPVLIESVLNAFQGTHLQCLVDCTLGMGGHSALLAKEHPELQLLIGIDQDEQAHQVAAQALKPFEDKLLRVKGNFADLGQILQEANIGLVDGVLLDLGVSSLQLDTPDRGFAFRFDGPLDMRMDRSIGRSAVDLLAEAEPQELERIFRDYGEIKRPQPLVQKIVHERKHTPIVSTKQLVQLLHSIVGHSREHHPMTLVFQALRMAVNGELEAIKAVLPQAIARLRKGGRLAVITFHSLEDRLVKHTFQQAAARWIDDPANPYTGRRKTEPVITLINRKPWVASAAEISHNPRSRSAKLRVVEKQ